MLDARPQGLAHDLVQIHEQVGAQHAVHFLAARGELSGEPLDGARLVGREVVDVHVREPLPPLHHEVHEGLEHPLLPDREPFTVAAGIEGPLAAVRRSAAFVRFRQTEQVFEPARPDEARAFDVEEEVTR